MSAAWCVRDSLGERPLARDTFPVSVGGAGCGIVLAGQPDGALGWLGLHDEQLFLQPEPGARLLHNGAEVLQSVWLHTGDVITAGGATIRVLLERGVRTLVVDDGSGGNATVPPVQEGSATVSGAGGDELERIARIRYQAGRQQVEAVARQGLNPKLVWSALVVLAVALLWFVSTGVSVQLQLTPEDGRVQVSGGLLPLHAGSLLFLRKGSYVVSASAPGYRPQRVPLEVTDASGQSLAITLAKLPGRLRVELPAPGLASAGGRQDLPVPGVIEVPAGRQQISISVPRYLKYAAEVDVQGGGVEQQLKPALVPDWATVKVLTQPVGARLLVDGVEHGATPAEVDLDAGAHKLELRLPGFRPWQNDLLVKPNEPQTVGPVKLGLPDGTIVAQSVPAGARVLVGGVYRGTTPLRVAVRPEVATVLGFEAPGFESLERQVSVAPGSSQTVRAELTPILGAIEVTANLADAEVFADGRKLGGVNASYRLPATAHQLVVRRDGYVDFSTTVTPRPGLSQTVHAELLTAAEQKMAGVPRRIRARGFIDLALMPVGEYVMGSSRREPGRRANEAERPVKLKRLFYMGLREISNAQFHEFRAEHQSGLFAGTTLNLDNQPVVHVTWQDAAAFCNWLSARDGLPAAYEMQNGELVAVTPMNTGYRLPTEAEWEFVARYRNGAATLRYPWGDSLPVAPHSGNYADKTALIPLPDAMPDYDDGYLSSAPVGSYPPSALGLYDLGGNVAEWTSDLYAASFASGEQQTDPLSAGAGNLHVARGASWRTSRVADLRLAARFAEGGERDDLGFRIARYVE